MNNKLLKFLTNNWRRFSSTQRHDMTGYSCVLLKKMIRDKNISKKQEEFICTNLIEWIDSLQSDIIDICNKKNG